VVIGGLADGLLDALGRLGPGLLHLAVAGLAFAETALFLDLLVPGEVGMVLAGAAAHRAGIGVAGLVAAGAAGAVVGDSCSYVLGRAAAAGRLPGSARALRRLGPTVERAEAFFDRRGGAAVFLGRWVGALRAVVPFVAGAARMPYGRFLAWNVAASIGWVSTVVLAGWALGSTVAATVDRVGTVVSAVVVAALVVWALRARRRRQRASAGG
jgi:membrane protein DedA with SNARE-associated domain